MGNKLRNIIWITSGILLMTILVYATTTITNDGITTGNGTFTGTFNMFSAPDARLQFNGFNSLLGYLSGSGGIIFNQTVPEAKDGISWNAYDLDSNSNRVVGWFVCHYNSTTGATHEHCSIETLDNSTGTPSINSHFTITYNSSQPQAIIAFPTSYVTGMHADTIYGTDTNNNLGMSSNIVIMRSNTTFSLYPSSQGTRALSVGNTSSGKIYLAALGSDYLQMQDHVEIVGNRMLIMTANTTAYLCNSTYVGSIYYDGTTFKHYGCNSTNWNALY